MYASKCSTEILLSIKQAYQRQKKRNMMFSTLLLALPLSQALVGNAPPCNSFGIDYQDGGRYFVEASRSSHFVALQYFSGCQNDFAENVLIDPKGNEKKCNRSPMQPDGAVQHINCDGIRLYTGEWSILVLSHGSGAEPILHQRDFYLSVGQESDVSTTPSPRTGCHGIPTKTMTITSITVSYLKVDMPNDFETPSTAVAIASTSLVSRSSARRADALTKATSAVTQYRKPVQTSMSIVIHGSSRQQLALPYPTASTIAAPPGSNHKGSPKSAAPVPFRPVQKPGRFQNPLSMGWRPSNSWRYTFVVEQSRMLGNAYVVPLRINKPLVAIVAKTFTTPSHHMPSIVGIPARL